MSEGLLAIGAFSRASLLSIRALRAYHEAGILVPARVDPVTGYRAYHASQLTDAAVLRRLRQLDLPLDQVREILHARDPATTKRVLARHASAMRERLDEVSRIVANLQEGVDRPGEHTPVYVRDEAVAHTLAVRGRVREADFAAFLGAAYADLEAAAARAGIIPIGPSGALYPHEITDDVEEVEAYVPIATPITPDVGTRGVIVSEVPAARMAVIVHSGDYESISDTYRLLGAWDAAHARPAPRPVREVYLVSYPETPDRFRTEIQWPITEENPT